MTQPQPNIDLTLLTSFEFPLPKFDQGIRSFDDYVSREAYNAEVDRISCREDAYHLSGSHVNLAFQSPEPYVTFASEFIAKHCMKTTTLVHTGFAHKSIWVQGSAGVSEAGTTYLLAPVNAALDVRSRGKIISYSDWDENAGSYDRVWRIKANRLDSLCNDHTLAWSTENAHRDRKPIAVLKCKHRGYLDCFSQEKDLGISDGFENGDKLESDKAQAWCLLVKFALEHGVQHVSYFDWNRLVLLKIGESFEVSVMVVKPKDFRKAMLCFVIEAYQEAGGR